MSRSRTRLPQRSLECEWSQHASRAFHRGVVTDTAARGTVKQCRLGKQDYFESIKRLVAYRYMSCILQAAPSFLPPRGDLESIASASAVPPRPAAGVRRSP